MRTKHSVLLHRKNHIKIVEQFVVMLLFGSLVAGCVKTIPLSSRSAVEFNGKSIISSSGENPGLIVTTPGKAILLGAFSSLFNDGNRIIEDYNVDDPAIYISQKLTEDISTKYGLKMANAQSDSDYVLDVRTYYWQLIYFLTNFNKYGFFYNAELELINTHDKKVIATGACSFKPDKSDNSLSLNQLLEHKATRLKEELKIVADYCINEFKISVLGI